MNKTEANKILTVATNAIQKEYPKLVIRKIGGTFSDNSLRIRIEVEQNGENGETEESRNFKKFASMYGLQATDLNKVFTNGGVQFKVVGLQPRRPRFPILAVRLSDGKRFKFPVENVKRIG